MGDHLLVLGPDPASHQPCSDLHPVIYRCKFKKSICTWVYTSHFLLLALFKYPRTDYHNFNRRDRRIFSMVQVVSCLIHNSWMQTCITNLQNYRPVNNCAMVVKQHSIGVLRKIWEGFTCSASNPEKILPLALLLLCCLYQILTTRNHSLMQNCTCVHTCKQINTHKHTYIQTPIKT